MIVDAEQYLIGVDCGELADPTAIAAAELEPGDPDYLVRVGYIQTLPLRTPFRQVADRIGEIESGLRTRGPVLVLVDSTGMGQSIPELAREKVESPVVSCRLTGGNESACRGLYWRIPKPEMVRELVRLIDQGRLRLPREYPTVEIRLAVAEALRELRDFQANQRKGGAGRVTFEGMKGSHDDIITALGLIALGASRWRRPVMLTHCRSS